MKWLFSLLFIAVLPHFGHGAFHRPVLAHRTRRHGVPTRVHGPHIDSIAPFVDVHKQTLADLRAALPWTIEPAFSTYVLTQMPEQVAVHNMTLFQHTVPVGEAHFALFDVRGVRSKKAMLRFVKTLIDTPAFAANWNVGTINVDMVNVKEGHRSARRPAEPDESRMTRVSVLKSQTNTRLINIIYLWIAVRPPLHSFMTTRLGLAVSHDHMWDFCRSDDDSIGWMSWAYGPPQLSEARTELYNDLNLAHMRRKRLNETFDSIPEADVIRIAKRKGYTHAMDACARKIMAISEGSKTTTRAGILAKPVQPRRTRAVRPWSWPSLRHQCAVALPPLSSYSNICKHQFYPIMNPPAYGRTGRPTRRWNR